MQRKTPDNGQRNCPKHVEFYSKNEIEELLHLVGFIIRMFHDERLAERRMRGAVPLRHPGTLMGWTETNLFFNSVKMSNNYCC